MEDEQVKETPFLDGLADVNPYEKYSKPITRSDVRKATITGVRSVKAGPHVKLTPGQARAIKEGRRVNMWEGSRALKNGAIAVLILNILDLVTTYIAIAHFGAEELNPIAKFLIGTYLLVPLKIIVVTSVMITAWKTTPKPVSVAGIWWVAGVYSMTIVMNTITMVLA